MKHVSLYLQLTLIILLSFGVTANGYTRNKTTEIASDFDKISRYSVLYLYSLFSF